MAMYLSIDRIIVISITNCSCWLKWKGIVKINTYSLLITMYSQVAETNAIIRGKGGQFLFLLLKNFSVFFLLRHAQFQHCNLTLHHMFDNMWQRIHSVYFTHMTNTYFCTLTHVQI